IHRILLDLMSNAIEACLFDIVQEKKWVVTLSMKAEDGHMLRFDVSDNGIGMSQETMDNLFTNVFSLKGQKGTGLGLLVSAKLVHENGGSIQVNSELGMGSTFTVWLPYEEVSRPSPISG
ncbi:MAG: ATP-binding protein, partial [Thermodesulfobacteriota bacterium]